MKLLYMAKDRETNMRRSFQATIIVAVVAVPLLVGLYLSRPSSYHAILNPTGLEIVNVKWGNMVNRSYESETARWINFTIINHSENLTFPDAPLFELEAYYDGFYTGIDKRSWDLQHGENEIVMMGNEHFSDYRLLCDGEVIWEGSLGED